MADVPVLDIVQAIAEDLESITIANGYHTDLGADVGTEFVEKKLTAPRATVWCMGKTRADGGQGRPASGRGLEGLIEVAVPANYDNAFEMAYKADDDVERCLSARHLMPNALPVQYEESRFLDRPEGLPIVLVQIRWTTAFRRASGS